MRFSGFDPLLAHWAETAPDAPALRFPGRNGELRTLSYAGLRAAVEERAAVLRESGKSCLGLFCENSPEAVIEFFASVAAGMQVVMLDPSEDCGDRIACADVDQLWGDPDLTDELRGALTSGVTDGAGRILFFTSGTTERQKAVVLTEQSLCASAYNGGAMLPLSPEDTLLCVLPLNHVFGFVCGLLWGLSCGACVALGRGLRHLLEDFALLKPTAVSVVPMLLGFLLKYNAINPELRLILVGAGDCPPPLIAAANARGLRVGFGYGLTETSSGVAISVEGDPFAMAVCPDDTITLAEDGEILIHAPTCMMQGYYKRPEATAAVLIDGVLHTGDLGRFDEDGKLHITGRKKDMLVLSDGTKLFLPEYEAEIARFLGAEDLAVVLYHGRPLLALHGAGEEREILDRLRPFQEKRPRGQQLSGIRLFADPLPRTATGKIMRWEIQQILEKEED